MHRHQCGTDRECLLPTLSRRWRRAGRTVGRNHGSVDSFLPAQWSHNNPVDILGDAEPERYAKSLEIAAKDPAIEGMLVVLTPQDMTNPTQIAEKLKPYANGLGKPVLASWMGGAEVAAGEQILDQAGIPSFQFPDSAVRAFN